MGHNVKQENLLSHRTKLLAAGEKLFVKEQEMLWALNNSDNSSYTPTEISNYFNSIENHLVDLASLNLQIDEPCPGRDPIQYLKCYGFEDAYLKARVDIMKSDMDKVYEIVSWGKGDTMKKVLISFHIAIDNQDFLDNKHYLISLLNKLIYDLCNRYLENVEDYMETIKLIANHLADSSVMSRFLDELICGVIRICKNASCHPDPESAKAKLQIGLSILELDLFGSIPATHVQTLPKNPKTRAFWLVERERLKNKYVSSLN